MRLLCTSSYLDVSAISKNKKFKYTFLADKEGTYWIHSHSPGQYPKGLRAPLIVRRPADEREMNYDSEQILTVSDWYYLWLALSAYQADTYSLGGWTLNMQKRGACQKQDPGVTALLELVAIPTMIMAMESSIRLRVRIFQ